MRAQRDLISFIGLGSKSAAPLLYSYLDSHPQVCTPKQATAFFSNIKKFSQGVAWYESHFADCEPESIRGELSGSYLQSSQAASLIARTYSEAKLLAVIENPLVTVKVAYLEALNTRSISPKISFTLFLKQNPEVLHSALYSRHLAQYFGYYSTADLMVIPAADVRDKPLEVIKKVFIHIGADPTFVPKDLLHLVPIEEVDEKKKPGFIKRFIITIKGLFKKAYLGILARLRPPALATESLSDAARRMHISPEIEKYLKDYYLHDVQALSRLLHRNLAVEWEIEPETTEVPPKR